MPIYKFAKDALRISSNSYDVYNISTYEPKYDENFSQLLDTFVKCICESASAKKSGRSLYTSIQHVNIKITSQRFTNEYYCSLLLRSYGISYTSPSSGAKGDTYDHSGLIGPDKEYSLDRCVLTVDSDGTFTLKIPDDYESQFRLFDVEVYDDKELGGLWSYK